MSHNASKALRLWRPAKDPWQRQRESFDPEPKNITAQAALRPLRHCPPTQKCLLQRILTLIRIASSLCRQPLPTEASP
jgi:hypothetical protein